MAACKPRDVAYVREMLVGFEVWRGQPSTRELAGRFDDILKRDGSVEPRFIFTPGGLLVRRLSPAGLMACLDIGLRGQEWLAAVCLRDPVMPRRTVPPVLRRARRLPTGLAVRVDHRDAAVPHATAVLQLHAAVLRSRRPAAWRVIDAVTAHGSATAAAAALGVSVQAVSKQVRAGQVHATRHTAAVIGELVAASE